MTFAKNLSFVFVVSFVSMAAHAKINIPAYGTIRFGDTGKIPVEYHHDKNTLLTGGVYLGPPASDTVAKCVLDQKRILEIYLMDSSNPDLAYLKDHLAHIIIDYDTDDFTARGAKVENDSYHYEQDKKIQVRVIVRKHWQVGPVTLKPIQFNTPLSEDCDIVGVDELKDTVRNFINAEKAKDKKVSTAELRKQEEAAAASDEKKRIEEELAH